MPWAEPHGRFTLMFEAFAIRVLQAAASIEQARLLLKLDWDSLQRMIDRAVERGLLKRNLDDIPHVSIDEKSFGRGHDDVSVLTDIEVSRVLEVVPGRDEQAADQLWSMLSDEQKDHVEAVALDMWQAFENSAESLVPQAEIVHDRSDISKHLNEAVGQDCRQEHKTLKQSGDTTLTGTKQIWLFNPENLSDDQWAEFEVLKEIELKTLKSVGHSRTVPLVLGIPLRRQREKVLREVVSMGLSLPTGPDQEGRENAAPTTQEYPDPVPPLHQQRPRRRLQ